MGQAVRVFFALALIGSAAALLWMSTDVAFGGTPECALERLSAGALRGPSDGH